MTLPGKQRSALASACKRFKTNPSSAMLNEFEGWSLQISTGMVAAYVHDSELCDDLLAEVRSLAKPGSIQESPLLGCRGIFFLPK